MDLTFVYCVSSSGCPQQIGPSLGRARLCEFSGQYYCDSCHHGDTTIIPARMVHNWDLTQRAVGAAHSGHFLTVCMQNVRIPMLLSDTEVKLAKPVRTKGCLRLPAQVCGLSEIELHYGRSWNPLAIVL